MQLEHNWLMQPEIETNTGAFAFLTQEEQMHNLTTAGLTVRKKAKNTTKINYKWSTQFY